MSAVDHSLTLHDLIELAHNRLLGVRVQIARRLVEEEYLGLGFEETACDQHSLALTAGEFGTEVADLGFIAVLHVHDAVMDAALAGNSFEVSLRCVGIAIPQILLNCVVEEDSVLRHNDNVLSERFKGQILDVLAINEYLAIRWIVDPEEEVQHGSLAETRRPDNCVCCAGLDFEVEVLEEVLDLVVLLDSHL